MLPRGMGHVVEYRGRAIWNCRIFYRMLEKALEAEKGMDLGDLG